MADREIQRRLHRKPSPYTPIILVVDDDASDRAFLRGVIEDLGYIVSEASSAREALRILDDVHIDVAVIDSGMPDLDGLDLVRALRRSSPKPKILVISSFLQDAMLAVALKLGADAAMDKDSSPRELLLVICRLLEDQFEGIDLNS